MTTDYREDHWNKLARSFHENLHNMSIPGLGKTTATVEMIQLDLFHHPDHHWIIAAPQHRLIEGDDNILSMFSDTVDVAHLKGKSRDNPHFNEDQCYIEGCSKCPHRETCPYLNQGWKSQVLVCPYEMLYTIPSHVGIHHRGYSEMVGWWGLVFEEEPTRAWFNKLTLTAATIPYVNMEDEQNIPYWGGNYRFFDHITFNEFDVDTIPKYRLYQTMKYYTDFHVHEYQGQYTLFCHRKNMVPHWASRVILNCATTPRAFREVMFGRTRFTEFKGDAPPLLNNILRIGQKWGVTMADKYKQGMYDYLAALEEKDVFMITKQLLEPFFEDVVTDIAHFGSSRGFNDYNKEYDLVVVYGGFHWTPLSRLMFFKLGVMHDIIDVLEDAEVIQAVNRFRPYFHPNSPIIIASNYSVMEHDEWSIIGQRVFSSESNTYIKSYKQTLARFTHCYVNKQFSRNDLILIDARTMTTKEIATKYNLSTRTIRRIYGYAKNDQTTTQL